MPIVRQASFAGGEIDPLLYGRTDHPKYPTMVRGLLNFTAAPQGAAKNRAGTRYIAADKDPTVSPRLIPFIWPSQNYMLEFGNLYVRFYSNGGVVGAPLEVATPFTSPMLPYLKYAQKDDTLLLCYGGQDPGAAQISPQALRRIAHTNWIIGAISFAVPAPAFLGAQTVAVQPKVPDGSHLARDWVWQLTELLQDANGNTVESSPVQITTSDGNYNPATTYGAGAYVLYTNGKAYTSLVGGNTGNAPDSSPNFWALGVVLFPDRPLPIAWLGDNPVGYTVIGYALYRGIRGGPAGLIAETNDGIVNVVVVQDVGAEPDYTNQPPASTDPFLLTGGGHDWPAVVTHFQQRRVFMRQGLHLSRIQASKTGQRTNFDTTEPSLDTDALNFDLDSQTIEEIRSAVSLRSLIVLTSTGASVVHGSGVSRAGSGAAIAPSSIDATKQSPRGASWVDPVVVDNAIVYPQAKGNSIRALAYDPYWGVLGNPGSDIAIVAQHLLRSHTVVDMTYQDAPDSIIWIAREDGTLLGITFVPSNQPDQQTYGWHQHTTDGAIEHVACVPEGTEDALYMVVRRTVNGATVRYIERMATRILPTVTVPDPKDATKTVVRDDVRFAVHLDASLSFDGRNVGAGLMTFVSDAGTYNGGEEGVLAASVATFAATDPNDVLMFDQNGSVGGPFRLTILSFTDATHVRVKLAAPLPAAFRGVPSTSWAFARRTMTGLGHLEGKSVMVLADGSVQGPFTVTGGAIALDVPGAVVLAGLPYNSDLELLDVAPDAVKPNVKSVLRLFFEVVASRGIYAGQDASRLRPWKERQVRDGFGAIPLATERVEVGIDADWNTGGRAFIRQADPLPLTIDAVSREVDIGGR